MDGGLFKGVSMSFSRQFPAVQSCLVSLSKVRLSFVRLSLMANGGDSSSVFVTISTAHGGHERLEGGH